MEHDLHPSKIVNVVNQQDDLHQNNENIHQKSILQDQCIQIQCSLIPWTFIKAVCP